MRKKNSRREGGLKAAITNKERYGEDYYVELGRRAGVMGDHSTKGFATRRELAAQAGRIGGMISRKGDSSKLTEAQKRQVRKEVEGL